MNVKGGVADVGELSCYAFLSIYPSKVVVDYFAISGFAVLTGGNRYRVTIFVGNIYTEKAVCWFESRKLLIFNGASFLA